MTSERQIKANRKNAKLGGVKSEEGKAVSKLNALKHGLLSSQNIINGENITDLEELNKKLIQELKPTGALEIVLVDRIAVNIWRLKRAMKIEKELLEKETKNNFSNDKESIYNYDLINDELLIKFTRYEITIERGLYKAIRELERLREAKKQMGSFGKNKN